MELRAISQSIFLIQSTLFLWTWKAGVIHLPQEHFLPENITSPILTSHLGHLNFSSFSNSYVLYQLGASIK